MPPHNSLSFRRSAAAILWNVGVAFGAVSLVSLVFSAGSEILFVTYTIVGGPSFLGTGQLPQLSLVFGILTGLFAIVVGVASALLYVPEE